MEKYKTIEVSFKSGHTAVWDSDQGDWDDYAYDGKVFIVKKNGAWVGIYNMDCVLSVVIK